MGGSGKSHLCHQIASRGDNIAAFHDATLTSTDPKRAGYGCLGEMVARLLSRSEDCVMDESHLTVYAFREKFREFCDEFLRGVEQEWIFFQNDVIGCINNLYCDFQNGRKELSRLEAVLGQSKVYVLPEPHTFPGYEAPRPVFKQQEPRFTSKEESLEWLQSNIAILKKERE